MGLKRIILSTIFLLVCFSSWGQFRGWDGRYVTFGLQAGLNYFSISTDQLPVEPGLSWMAGFTGKAALYEEFQIIYGINLSDNRVIIEGREKREGITKDPLHFGMIAFQGKVLGSLILVEDHLSLEAGPVIQVNGKFDARQDVEYFYVGDYDIQAIQLEEVSAVNINFAVGISGGFETVKLWLQYQHGLNNFFKGLRDQGLQETDPDLPVLRGNLSIVTGGIKVYL